MIDFLKRLFSAENWKTSVAGVLTLLGLTLKCYLNGGELFGCIADAWPVAFAGLGLLFASDAKPAVK